MNQEIFNYVQQSRANGASDDEIKQALLNAGNTEGIIAEYFFPQPSFQTAPEKHKRRPIFYIRIVLLAILVLGILYAIIASIDEPLRADDDLHLQISKISDQENDYNAVVSAAQKVIVPDQRSGCVDWEKSCTTWNEVAVKNTIERNREALTLFDGALKNQKIQYPQFADVTKIGPSNENPPYQNLRELGRLNILYSKYLLQQKKYLESLAQARKGVQLGSMMENTENSMLTYLVAMAIKNNSLSQMKEVLRAFSPDQTTKQEYSAWISSVNDGRKGFRNAFLYQYVFFLGIKSEILDAWENGEDVSGSSFGKDLNDIPHFGYFYLPNRTQNMHANYYRKLALNASLSCEEASRENQILNQEVSDAMKESLISLILSRNSVGKIVFKIETAGNEGPFKRKCEEDTLTTDIKQILNKS